MTSAASPSHIPYERYLARTSTDVKHEWCDGVVYAMSRGTPEHARLTAAISRVSESTERYDRDAKFQGYKRLPSLREYVLIALEERRIEVYRLQDDHWICETAAAGGRVTIHGREVAVDDVYR